jgi:hypothetical protein
MSGAAWGALVAGVAAGALGALAFDRVHARALGELEGRLAVVDNRLHELGAIKAPVDAHEKARARFEAQVRWIDEERARQRCPGLVVAQLELERRGSTVDAVVLEGGTLALVGRAESQAELDALASSLRGAGFARALRSGSAPAADGASRRFGLLAAVEQPPCPPPGDAQTAEAQVASRTGGR